jgi:hypothetical protein
MPRLASFIFIKGHFQNPAEIDDNLLPQSVPFIEAALHVLHNHRRIYEVIPNAKLVVFGPVAVLTARQPPHWSGASKSKILDVTRC